jgi:CheY-like chemotaxis protein
VLVVEDNDDSRRTLTLLLTHYGYEVHAAPDGPSALREALQRRPAVVISDIGLPGLDGWELARQLRAHLGAGPLLVALTAYGSPADQDRSLEAGFDVHLTKPIDLPRLLAVLTAPGHGGPAAAPGTHGRSSPAQAGQSK